VWGQPMSIEAPRPTGYGFDFTEREQLYYRISNKRFEAFFTDVATTIHRIEVSYNNYGEFLFVTASRETGQGRQPVTFYGAGFHEMRERWISQEWFWYKGNTYSAATKLIVPKEEAKEILERRWAEIAPYVTAVEQTRRGQLFEMLADLTDEDGAVSEMEEWGMDDFE
jgi:hypothetical protein